MRSFYEQPIQLPLAIAAMSASMCRFLLTPAEHCFGNVAEKVSSFAGVSRDGN